VLRESAALLCPLPGVLQSRGFGDQMFVYSVWTSDKVVVIDDSVRLAQDVHMSVLKHALCVTSCFHSSIHTQVNAYAGRVFRGSGSDPGFTSGIGLGLVHGQGWVKVGLGLN